MTEPTRDAPIVAIDAQDAVEADEKQRQEDEEVGRLLRETGAYCLIVDNNGVVPVWTALAMVGGVLRSGRGLTPADALRALRDAIGGEG